MWVEVSESVLDNFERIKQIDKSGMLSFCVEAAKHYGEAFNMAKRVSVDYSKPQTVIVAGMGGSGIGGELLKDWARDAITVPIEVNREYSLPAYANKKTLALIVSYSGETEESLSAFLDALKHECMIFCVSSGGELLELAEKIGVPFLRVPIGMPPRAALPYLFSPLPIILEKIGLFSNISGEFPEAITILEKLSIENSPKRPLKDSFSKTLASKISGTVPIIYGFRAYRAVAQRFKTQFNENSKVLSKWEFFSELNHNEIVGWEEARELAKCFSVIFIRDKNEPEEIHRRIEATKEIVGSKSEKVFEVWSSGSSRLAKMLSTICIGDFTSVYLAILRGVDPTPVKTIASLKEKTKQSGVKEKVIRELQKIAVR